MRRPTPGFAGDGTHSALRAGAISVGYSSVMSVGGEMIFAQNSAESNGGE